MGEEKPQIAYEILAYLVENSNAQDTLEGIIQWWLLERTIKQQTAQVKAAMSILVAEDLVLERQGNDGRSYYKINRQKLDDIRLLLKQRSEQSGPRTRPDD